MGSLSIIPTSPKTIVFIYDIGDTIFFVVKHPESSSTSSIPGPCRSTVMSLHVYISSPSLKTESITTEFHLFGRVSDLVNAAQHMVIHCRPRDLFFQEILHNSVLNFPLVT